LATASPVLPVDDPDLVGALIWAARRSPLEVTRAVVGTYRDIEAGIAVSEAVCAWIRAHG
jgi:hypothetical protein